MHDPETHPHCSLNALHKTAEAELLLQLDKHWTSDKHTAVRKELWSLYRAGKESYENELQLYKQTEKLTSRDKEAIELYGINEVGKHILVVHQNARFNRLFDYLNFMEFMGTLYVMKEQGLMEKISLNQIFGQKLEIYIRFYELYFKNKFNYDPRSGTTQLGCEALVHACDCSPALKLLLYFNKRRKK